MECRNCGREFAEDRAALGFDYCTRTECVDACLKPLNIVAVHVNKASDQYVLREDLNLPEHTSSISVEPGWAPLHTTRRGNERRRARRRSTVAAIDALEAELDAALAEETDPSRRNKLVNDFNARLRQYDIRYRRIRQRH